MAENVRLNASLLVVEDDEDTREMLRFLLEQHAAKVVAVESVEAALDSYRKAPPDILVTDIAMAGYNGYALISQMRELDKQQNKRTPAIALTAFTSAADRETAFAAGFDAYLEKPFGPAELLSTIRTLLGPQKQSA
jgi:CheY-like chemotaxis protein